MISAATFNHIQVLLAKLKEQDDLLDQNILNASAGRRWNEIANDISSQIAAQEELTGSAALIDWKKYAEIIEH